MIVFTGHLYTGVYRFVSVVLWVRRYNDVYPLCMIFFLIGISLFSGGSGRGVYGFVLKELFCFLSG